MLNKWFDQHVKGEPQDIPQTAVATLKLLPSGKAASFEVAPDQVGKLQSVNVYYSHDSNARARFWYSATATRDGNKWKAELPVREKLPLFAFADCVYGVGQSVVTFQGTTNAFSLNSNEVVHLPDDIDMSQLNRGAKHKRIFEDFEHGWRDWCSVRQSGVATYKFQDPAVDFSHGKAMAIDVDLPKGQLSFRVRITKNQWLTGVRGPQLSFSRAIQIKEAGKRRIVIKPSEFITRDKKKMTDWTNIYSMNITIYDGSTKSSLDLYEKHDGIIKRIEWLDE